MEEPIKPEDLETPIQPEPTVAEMAQQEVEDRARRQGWRPREEYNGPADRWVPAQEFLDRGEREWPIMRERMRTLTDRLSHTERELTETKGLVKEQTGVLSEMRDMLRTSEKRGYDRAMTDLGDRERRAVQEANVAEYDAVQAEKRKLGPPPATEPVRANGNTPPPPPQQTQTPQDAATVAQWVADNPWFNSDPMLQSVATAVHGAMRQANPYQPLAENLAEVKAEIIRRYPEKFENPRQRRPAAVSSSSTPVAPKVKHKTMADLPQDAKDAYARFKRTMSDYSEEEYLRSYFGAEYDSPGA